MQYILIAAVLYLLYRLFDINKKFEALVESRGMGRTYSFNVEFKEAVYKHPMFIKAAKIKPSLDIDSYSKWPKAEQSKFGDFIAKHVENKTWFRLTYLSSEDAFFIKNSNEQTDFVKLDWGPQVLTTELILGDNDKIFEDKLEIGLMVQKNILYGYINQDFGEMGKESNNKVLFRFPFTTQEGSLEGLKDYGFDVKQDWGDDVFENALGEMQSIPTRYELKQNDCVITIFS